MVFLLYSMYVMLYGVWVEIITYQTLKPCVWKALLYGSHPRKGKNSCMICCDFSLAWLLVYFINNYTLLYFYSKLSAFIYIFVDFATKTFLDCLPGHFSIEGSTNCSQCDRGYYQTLGSQPSCLLCPAGIYLFYYW